MGLPTGEIAPDMYVLLGTYHDPNISHADCEETCYVRADCSFYGFFAANQSCNHYATLISPQIFSSGLKVVTNALLEQSFFIHLRSTVAYYFLNTNNSFIYGVRLEKDCEAMCEQLNACEAYYFYSPVFQCVLYEYQNVKGTTFGFKFRYAAYE